MKKKRNLSSGSMARPKTASTSRKKLSDSNTLQTADTRGASLLNSLSSSQLAVTTGFDSLIGDQKSMPSHFPTARASSSYGPNRRNYSARSYRGPNGVGSGGGNALRSLLGTPRTPMSVAGFTPTGALSGTDFAFSSTATSALKASSRLRTPGQGSAADLSPWINFSSSTPSKATGKSGANSSNDSTLFQKKILMNKVMSSPRSLQFHSEKGFYENFKQTHVQSEAYVKGLSNAQLRKLYIAKCNDLGVTVNEGQSFRFFEYCKRHCVNGRFVIRDNGLQYESAKVIADFLKGSTKFSQIDLRKNILGDKGVLLLMRVICKSPFIVHVDLSSNDLSPEGVAKVIRKLRGNNVITSIDLSSHEGLHRNRLASAGSQPLANVLKNNQIITFLNLSSTSLGYDGIVNLCRGLYMNQVLISLDISNNDMGPLGTEVVANVIGTTMVQDLNLSRNKIGDAGATFIVQAIPSNSERAMRVTRLDLSQNEMSRQGLNPLVQMLKGNTVLEELILDKNVMENVDSLAAGLADNVTIRTLSLNNCRLGSLQASGIAEALLKNKGLTNLHLSKNMIDDAALIELGTSLLANRWIRTLDLSSNKISSAGLDNLGKALKTGKIESVNLKDNNIDSDGCLIFKEAIAANHKLKRINLEDNPLPVKYAKDIQQMIEKNNVSNKTDKVPYYRETIDELKLDEERLDFVNLEIERMKLRAVDEEAKLDEANQKFEEVKEENEEATKEKENELERQKERKEQMVHKLKQIETEITITRNKEASEMKRTEELITIYHVQKNEMRDTLHKQRDKIKVEKASYEEQINMLRMELLGAQDRRYQAQAALKAFENQIKEVNEKLEQNDEEEEIPKVSRGLTRQLTRAGSSNNTASLKRKKSPLLLKKPKKGKRGKKGKLLKAIT